jgi:probable F420-dependent oxidoreductase
LKYGVTIFITDYSIQPAELARELEARGLESLWLPEHSHIPVSRRSPWPGGAELPKMYYDVYEPFVALAAAAAVTTRLRLATGVCLVVQRDPIQTAKDVATLDRVSGGRFLFGVGAGWNAEEMANHGTREFGRRFALLRERVEAMKAIWTASQAEYHGEHVDFEPIQAWPKPVQKPHPKIHVGGGFPGGGGPPAGVRGRGGAQHPRGPGGARRAARFGDGWMPIHGRDEIVASLPAFRELAEKQGRDPASLEVTVFAMPPDAEALARYAAAGITRAVFGLPPVARDDALPLLDRYAELARRTQP